MATTIMRRSLLVLVLAFSACGGDDSGGPQNPGGGTVTFGALCQGVADTICGKTAECQPPGDPGCVAALKSACCSGNTCTMTYPGKTDDALQDCLDAIEGLSCTAFNNGQFTSCN